MPTRGAADTRFSSVSAVPVRPIPRRFRKRVAEDSGLSLQAVDDCWAAGRLRVRTPSDTERAGQALPLEELVFFEDEALLDGALVDPALAPAREYAVLNKPINVTSTASDPRGGANLAPCLRAMPRGFFPVGRLDRETTGLLLFTNDGDLATCVLRPDHLTTKSYWLWLDDSLSEGDPRLAQMLTGVPHNGQTLCAHAVRIVTSSEAATELELELTTGRKRQIRHMCRVLGFHLQHLHRKRVGPLTDAGLALGEWRLLDAREVETLWAAVGGRDALRVRQVAALERQAHAARVAGAPLERLEQWLDGESAEP